MKMILDDVAALRRQVDIVVVAFHWGVIWVPRVIADYQVIAAHACIDAGADMILGHHAHVPKAIEVYKGKAIFYSLSNFCMTKPFPSPKWSEKPWVHGALRNYADQNPEYAAAAVRPRCEAHAARESGVREGRREERFVPADDDRQAVPARSAARGRRALRRHGVVHGLGVRRVRSHVYAARRRSHGHGLMTRRRA